MTTIQEHMRQWGVPDRYWQDYDWSRWPDEVREECRAVHRAANWYREQDAALIEMVVAGDSAAIREWADSDCWDKIAVETSSDGDPGTYAEDVGQALRDLADAIERVPESQD